jgi:hypothetical protein
MNENDINFDQLIFRRQYLLTSCEGLKIPFLHKTIVLSGNYKLFVHNDLKLTHLNHLGKDLIILGDIYDYRVPKADNHEILNRFKALDFDEILAETSKMAGRFVIIFSSDNELKLFHDATASRKLYYANTNGDISCSSNPHLLATALNINLSQETNITKFYDSKDFINNLYAHIGDRTQYDEIFQLIPNHFISLLPFFIERYYPFEAIKDKTDKEIVAEASVILKGLIESASNRYQLMIPLTSGFDSRLILAASKNIKENIMFYLNVKSNQTNSPDMKFHKKILSKLGLKYNLLHIDENYPPEFKEMCLKNNPYIDPNFFDIFYNYLNNFPNHLNLPGILIPIVKSLRREENKVITGELIAGLNNFEKYPFAVDFYSKWLLQLEGKNMGSKIDIYDLIYWEDILPNRNNQLQQDKDIAQEEFTVFNSSYLLSLMLAYTMHYRKKPYLRLHKEIIKELWPELLNFPFNPSLRNSIYQIFIKLHVYEPLLKIKKYLLG